MYIYMLYIYIYIYIYIHTRHKTQENTKKGITSNVLPFYLDGSRGGGEETFGYGQFS